MKLILLFLFLFTSSSLWAMGHLSPQTENNSLARKAAPDVVLSRSDGTSASVISSSLGKKIILVFWATWCPHCIEELGTINDSLVPAERKGIKIILVDVGETKEVVKNYIDQRQLKLVSFVDENSFLQESYHLVGIPTIMFIDEKGNIRNMTHVFPSDYADYFT